MPPVIVKPFKSRDFSSPVSRQYRENKKVTPSSYANQPFSICREGLIVDCFYISPGTTFYRKGLLAFGAFNVNQIIEQADAVVVGQHIKRGLAARTRGYIAVQGGPESGFQDGNLPLEGLDLGLELRDLVFQGLKLLLRRSL